MTLVVLSVLWCGAVALLLTRAIVQYRSYEVIGPLDSLVQSPPPTVSVIIPARDEELSIGRCVRSIVAQRYPSEALEILVIDDNSTDDTRSIVRELMKEDPRVRLIEAGALPADWLGKPHACARGAGEARGDWLCFLDADTTSQPLLITTAVQDARSRGIDLLSLQPFQELITFGERVILPTGFFLLAFTQDLRKTNDPAFPAASVNGQFLLIRKSAYEAAGGHAAVRNQLAEDSALATNVKAAGFAVAVVGTQGLIRTRMYTDFRSLWEGTARQAAMLLGGSFALAVAAAGAIAMAAATVGLPIWALTAVGDNHALLNYLAFAFSMAGSLALLGTHIGAARYFRIPFWYGLLCPLGYVMGAGVLLHAIWQRSRGQVRWKGRVYGDRAASANLHSETGTAQ